MGFSIPAGILTLMVASENGQRRSPHHFAPALGSTQPKGYGGGSEESFVVVSFCKQPLSWGLGSVTPREGEYALIFW